MGNHRELGVAFPDDISEPRMKSLQAWQWNPFSEQLVTSGRGCRLDEPEVVEVLGTVRLVSIVDQEHHFTPQFVGSRQPVFDSRACGVFSSKFTQLLLELPCLHVCPKSPFPVRLFQAPTLALQFAFSSMGSCFQIGFFGLESGGKIMPIDAIFCELLSELLRCLFQFFDALLASANSDLGVLKFRGQLLRALAGLS
jgi:hypothetical protein